MKGKSAGLIKAVHLQRLPKNGNSGSNVSRFAAGWAIFLLATV